jgi:hypothetical protein
MSKEENSIPHEEEEEHDELSATSPIEYNNDSDVAETISSTTNVHFTAEDEQQTTQQIQVDINNQPLTAELLAEQNELYSNKLLPKPNAIRAWAADLPEVPDSVQPILTTSHIFEMEPLADLQHEQDSTVLNDPNQPRIQETKDVFSDTQKIAYVSLCYLTSLEVVYDFQGRDFTYARMSADNWQRKLMRMLYVHMDISSDGKKNSLEL